MTISFFKTPFGIISKGASAEFSLAILTDTQHCRPQEDYYVMNLFTQYSGCDDSTVKLLLIM